MLATCIVYQNAIWQLWSLYMELWNQPEELIEECNMHITMIWLLNTDLRLVLVLACQCVSHKQLKRQIYMPEVWHWSQEERYPNQVWRSRSLVNVKVSRSKTLSMEISMLCLLKLKQELTDGGMKYTLPTDQLFNLEFQFESLFNFEFQPKFGIQLGIPIPMGINLGERSSCR